MLLHGRGEGGGGGGAEGTVRGLKSSRWENGGWGWGELVGGGMANSDSNGCSNFSVSEN